MSTLVTGGMGFIGSHLVKHLLDNGENVLVLDDLSGSHKDNLKTHIKHENLKIIEGSILNARLVSKLMRKVSKCYHLAAILGVERINKDPIKALNVNLQGSEIVLTTASKFGVTTLLASSSEVYGKNIAVPLKEESDRVLGSTKINRWSYSDAKALDEMYAFELHKRESFPVIVARFFNTVGPRQSGSYGMVLPRFVSAALTNQPLVVYGDGTQSRTFCSVLDVVQAIVALMETDYCIGHTFNIGSSNEITIKELANKVILLTNSKSEITYKKHYEVFGEHFEEPQRRVPDISKIKKTIDWQPKRTLDEIIIEIANNLRANES